MTYPINEEAFDMFWEAYPRKTAKKKARKVWAKEPHWDVHLLITDITLRLHSGHWRLDQKQYIPHPATYLNQERWEDEIIAPVASVKVRTTRDTTLEHDLTDTSWAE